VIVREASRFAAGLRLATAGTDTEDNDPFHAKMCLRATSQIATTPGCLILRSTEIA
jgi:hypothetical protein